MGCHSNVIKKLLCFDLFLFLLWFLLVLSKIFLFAHNFVNNGLIELISVPNDSWEALLSTRGLRSKKFCLVWWFWRQNMHVGKMISVCVSSHSIFFAHSWRIYAMKSKLKKEKQSILVVVFFHALSSFSRVSYIFFFCCLKRKLTFL